MRRFILLPIACALACSSAPPKPTAEPVADPIVEPSEPAEVACVATCMPNEDDKCVTSAVVSDGSTVETEEVECPAICCSRTVTSTSQDIDEDGVMDDSDQCPTEPEDIDAFEDEDGCPDPDNDKDNILDVDDVCELEPETPNGFQDEDGCPD